MKSRFSKIIDTSILIEPKHIQQFSDLFESVVEKLGTKPEKASESILWTITLSDDVSLGELSTPRLLNLANTKAAKIIRIIGESNGLKDSAFKVLLYGDGAYPMIMLDATSENSPEIVSEFRKEALNIVGEIRPWYDKITRWTTTSIFSLFLLSYIVLSALHQLASGTFASESPNLTDIPFDGWRFLLLLFLIFVVAIGLLFSYLDKLKDRYVFPKFECTIGNGENRHASGKWLRGTAVSIGIAIVIAMII